jgi:hypothetical protein
LISTHLSAWRNYLEYFDKFLLKSVWELFYMAIIWFC